MSTVLLSSQSPRSPVVTRTTIADRIVRGIAISLLRWARHARTRQAARQRLLLQRAAEDRNLRFVRARLDRERTANEAFLRLMPPR
jgi:hypothetical protein